MPDKDFTVSITGIPQVGHIPRKPCYLISLDGSDKKKGFNFFIAIDKVDFSTNFLQVKGIYVDLPEEEISKRFAEIVAATPKDAIVDIMFPEHRVHSIRSLVFNANKPSTLVK